MPERAQEGDVFELNTGNRKQGFEIERSRDSERVQLFEAIDRVSSEAIDRVSSEGCPQHCISCAAFWTAGGDTRGEAS